MKGVAVVAVAVLVALLLGTAASPAARSGLHGRVCRGPLPVDTGAPSACRAAPQRVVFFLVRSERRYVVRSATDGTYLITLPPGIYRAQLPVHVGVTRPVLRPAAVRVRAGHDDRLDFYLQIRPIAAAAG
jgi:hypothetical protein